MRRAMVELRNWAHQDPKLTGRFQSLRRITLSLDGRISVDKARHFASMFSDFEGSKDGQPYTIKRQSLNILSNFTTNPQAEVLVFGKVPPTAITTIFFNSSSDLDEFRAQCQLPKHIKLEVGSNLFSYRADYSEWKRVRSIDQIRPSDNLDDEIPF
jgi:hypothetical protein